MAFDNRYCRAKRQLRLRIAQPGRASQKEGASQNRLMSNGWILDSGVYGVLRSGQRAS